MGRYYIVEELVENYLVNLQTGTGLLIGQSSAQRDFVALAVRTPPQDGDNRDDVDVEWVTEHARQVCRMLPGGVCVLGVFLITPPELSTETQNTLRKLIFAVDKALSRWQLWSLTEEDVSERVGLHICSKTKKATCRTFDVRDPKSSAKPADWKYQSGVSAAWPLLQCSVEVDLHFPVSETSYTNPEKVIKDGLQEWAKQVEDSVSLLNGKCTSDNFELLSTQKKSTRQPQAKLQPRILTRGMGHGSEGPSPSASVQTCRSTLVLSGLVYCQAYVHANKPRSKQAAEAIKRDLMNTVACRTEMLFEDFLMGGSGEDSITGCQSLPRRVFAPVPDRGFTVCDYMFPDESLEDVRERLKELLDLDVPEDDIVATLEVTSDAGARNRKPAVSQTDFPAAATKSQKALHGYAGVAAAGAVVLFSVVASFFYLSD